MLWLEYKCPKCGVENVITNFSHWLFTPHLGAKKYMKCGSCHKRSLMPRQNWNHPWLDWPTKGGDEC